MSTPDELNQNQKQDIKEFLDTHPVGVLATVSAEKTPDASTVYFSSDDNLTIAFTTKRDTLKHANIELHPTVALAVYDAASQTTLQITGAAKEVRDEADAQEIYRRTVHSAQQTGSDTVPPIAKISAGPYVAYRVEPESIIFTHYGHGNSFNNALKHAVDFNDEDTDDPA